METRVHPCDLPRASRVTSELLPSRAVVRSTKLGEKFELTARFKCVFFIVCNQVTGLTKPLVSQVKDAAYFRPKSQGQDGAQWNDPEIHAPEARQVLFVRPDLFVHILFQKKLLSAMYSFAWQAFFAGMTLPTRLQQPNRPTPIIWPTNREWRNCYYDAN
jgi:hypothetical protein